MSVEVKQADENRGTIHPLPKTLRYDKRVGYLWDGSLMVADLDSTDGESVRLRGWGHLTGTGGLNMTENEAATYQDRVGKRIEVAWNAHDELLAALKDALNVCIELIEVDGESDLITTAELRDKIRAALQKAEGK